jgi:hypothetical protein
MHATSLRGRIGISSLQTSVRSWTEWSVRTSHVTTSTSAEYKDGRGNQLRSIIGFKWSTLSQPNRHPSDFNLVVPYWFPAALTGILAAAFWPRSVQCSVRFSLRTLLIATTLIALFLGTIVLLSGQ